MSEILVPTWLVLPSPRLFWEWHSPLLPDAVRLPFLAWAERRWEDQGETSTITCIWRSRLEKEMIERKIKKPVSWIHGDWRGIDARVRLENGKPVSFEERYREQINREFPLAVDDRVEPLAHGTAPHAHFTASLDEAAAWWKRHKL